MQVKVSIDDALLRAALQASNLPTKAAVIEEGLRMVIALHRFADLLSTQSIDIEQPPHH